MVRSWLHLTFLAFCCGSATFSTFQTCFLVRPGFQKSDCEQRGAFLSVTAWPDFMKTSGRLQEEFTKNSRRIPEEFMKNSRRIQEDFTKNSRRIRKEFTKNSQRIQEEFTKTSRRLHEEFTKYSGRIHEEFRKTHISTLKQLLPNYKNNPSFIWAQVRSL